jgi:hypothetical protein
VREELETQNRGGPLQQFFNRPAVLLTLLVLCLGIITWTFWPSSPDTLFLRGQAAMTHDPPDWEQADDAFRMLEERFPNHEHKEEVAAFRQRINEFRADRQAFGIYRPRSEGQTLYEQGLRLRQQGAEAEAQRVWRNLAKSFRDVEPEEKWVKMAEAELRKPSERALSGEARWAPVQAALKRARELRDQRRNGEAEEIWQGLEELYGKDPSAQEIMAELRRDRGH